MNIGALDRKITIQSNTQTKSSTTGEVTYVWATLASVWATLTYPKGGTDRNEAIEQGRSTTITPVEFTIYYRTGVTEGMRILYDSEYFNIMRVNKVGQRNEMLKLVTEKKY